MQEESIFVGIPSYRDSECQHTVSDLFNNAAHPERIFVGICFQYSKENDTDFFEHFPKQFENQITIQHIPHTEATGPCWARYMSQKLYKNEKYYLSLDSHMRFEKNWDETMIKLLLKCKNPEKSILSSYPPSYELPNTIHRNTNPIFTCAKEFGKDGMLRLVGKELKHPWLCPKLASFWISGFSFSLGTIINEVPYNPNLPFLFFGEESSMTVRLWTSGWDFYAPCVNIVYHLWERTHRPNFRENTDEQNKLEKLSQHRVKVLLGIEGKNEGDNDNYDFEKYGLGSIRSLSEYEEFSGVNFKDSIISEKAKYGGIPKESFQENLLDMILAFQSALGK